MVLGGVVGVNAFIDQKVASIPRVKLKTAANTDPGSPANFLLIGSDSRAFVQTPEEAQAFGNQASNGITSPQATPGHGEAEDQRRL